METPTTVKVRIPDRESEKIAEIARIEIEGGVLFLLDKNLIIKKTYGPGFWISAERL